MVALWYLPSIIVRLTANIIKKIYMTHEECQHLIPVPVKKKSDRSALNVDRNTSNIRLSRAELSRTGQHIHRRQQKHSHSRISTIPKQKKRHNSPFDSMLQPSESSPAYRENNGKVSCDANTGSRPSRRKYRPPRREHVFRPWPFLWRALARATAA